MAEITVAEVIKKRTAWEEHYQALHTIQKEDDDYYELVYDAGIPKKLGYAQMTPSTARDWVDFGIMHYTLDNPKVIVPPRNTSDTAKDQAIQIERFENYWINRMIFEIKDNAKQLLKYGESFFKLVVDDTFYGVQTTKMKTAELEAFEEKRASLFPLIVTCPNPINVLCSPAHRGLIPKEVIEYYEMTVSEAEDLCERNNWEKIALEGKKSTDMVKWTSYYSAVSRCFLIENEAVLTPAVQINYLGFPPYVHIPSGLGSSSYAGKPEYKYRSILHSKKSAIKMQTRNLSQIDAINSKWAWAWVELKGDMELITKLYGEKGAGFDMSPLEAHAVPPEIEVKIHQGESPPLALYQYSGTLASLAEPPPILGGNRSPGTYSGYGNVVQLSTAKPRYKDAFKNFEDGLSVLMGMGARVVETVLKHKIATYEGEHINPAVIKGHYDNEVHLLAEPPEAADMRKSLGNNLWNGGQGSISLKTALVHYHDMTNEEADEEIAQKLAETGIFNPAISTEVAIDAAERLGMEKSKQLLEGQKSGAPAPGVPGGTGAESVTRLQRGTPEMGQSQFPQEAEVAGVPIE